MPLANRTRIGPYEIVAPIGAGGMGEVYKARDTRLDRTVAIKVLSQQLSSTPEARTRFEREAKTIAALNHPNICTLYDIGMHEGADYLVMEYLEGESLAHRLEGGALPLAEALKIAMEIADALDKAHRQRVTHRDLKPGNIMLTKSGAKLLDFGLAKITQESQPAAALSALPTNASLTAQGTILGTLQYMAPEQLEGREVDARTDIFAFGAVLYEMVTGQRAFEGKSQASLISAIMSATPPPLSTLQPVTPPLLEKVVTTALAKDPDDRWQTARDLRLQLKWIADGTELGSKPSGEARRDTPRWTPRIAWILSGIVLAALAIGLAIDRQQPTSPEWNGTFLVGGSSVVYGPRISPTDSRKMAFVMMEDRLTQVALLDTESGNWNLLTKDRTQGWVNYLSWSHDGTKIYYDRYAARAIYSVPAVGGPERLVLESAGLPEALSDGSLLVTQLDAQRNLRLHRFHPDKELVEPLEAFQFGDFSTSSDRRAFPGNGRFVFYGADPQAPTSFGVFTYDFSTRKSLPIAQKLWPGTYSKIPFAIDLEGHSVLMGIPAGDAYSVVSVSDTDETNPWFTVTARPLQMEAAPDGSVYIDQLDRPLEILNLPADGSSFERIGISTTAPLNNYLLDSVQFSDGRVLLPAAFAGRSHLMVAEKGKAPVPFIDTGEETSMPATTLGSSEVAFVLGNPVDRTIGIASVSEGRVTRRIRVAGNGQLNRLAASVDGFVLYYVSEGKLWSIPSSGGEPKEICAAEYAAVHPNGKEVVVSITADDGFRFMRVQLSDGHQEPIVIRDSRWPIFGTFLSAHAISRDDKMLVILGPKDSWYAELGILDLRNGSLRHLPPVYDADFLGAGWTPDGRIVTMARVWKSSIWRFRRAPAKGN